MKTDSNMKRTHHAFDVDVWPSIVTTWARLCISITRPNTHMSGTPRASYISQPARNTAGQITGNTLLQLSNTAERRDSLAGTDTGNRYRSNALAGPRRQVLDHKHQNLKPCSDTHSSHSQYQPMSESLLTPPARLLPAGYSQMHLPFRQ